MSIYHLQNPTTLIFDHTFLDDDFSTISDAHALEGERRRDWLLRVAIFFGFPVDTSRPFIFVISLFLMPFIFLRNVLKLPAIFLPLWIVKHLDLIRSILHHEFKDPNQLAILRVLAGLGEAAAILLTIPFYVVGNIGRLLLQPVKSVRHIYNTGHPYLAVLTAIVIAVAYMAIFPFVLYGLGPIIVAKAATVLPASVMHAVHAVTSAVESIGHAIAPVCEFLGTHLLGAFTHLFGLTAMQSGLGQLIGLVMLSVGSTLTVINERVTEWARWYFSPREKREEVVVVEVEKEHDNHSTHWLGKKLNRFFHKVDHALAPKKVESVAEKPTFSNLLFFAHSVGENRTAGVNPRLGLPIDSFTHSCKNSEQL